MPNPVFEARAVSYSYQDVTALDRLTLTVHRGEQLALLGANGSGKSTLLRLLSGLAFPRTGEILFDGQPLTEKAMEEDRFAFAFRKRVGIVFQNPDIQLFNPTVFDELAFGPLQLRWPAQQIRDRVTAMLRQLNIEHLQSRPPHRLSGGEKKRVALASVMILEPEVLLLDEPTAALDPKSEEQILEMLSSWTGSGKTVVIATHDLASLERIASRCVLFESGALVAEGDPLTILHDVPLLERTRMVHIHRHTHSEPHPHPHPHLHH
ncbi:MAG: energy-coupling factor ABC transporter ATP-binding protein [Acidobacteriota bacterium]|nr:energy-coupling factor ABC transporter ATP-binding protein [Acidobacteriota bacterium]